MTSAWRAGAICIRCALASPVQIMRKHQVGFAALVLAACGAAAAAAAPRTLPVVNGGFEQAASADRIPGWTKAQHAGVQAYDMSIDRASAAEGHASFRMRRLREQVYGLLSQTLDVSAYAGKTLELSAKVKTEDVGPGGWVLFIDAAGGRESVAATGTGKWRALKVRLKVGAGTPSVTIGAMLLDRGTAWLDDVQLHVVGK